MLGRYFSECGNHLCPRMQMSKWNFLFCTTAVNIRPASPCSLEIDARQLFKDIRLKAYRLHRQPQPRTAFAPSVPLGGSLPHPALPLSPVVGGSRENVDYREGGKVPPTIKSNIGTQRGMSQERPLGGTTGCCLPRNRPGQEIGLNVRQGQRSNTKCTQTPRPLGQTAMSLLISA